MKLTTGMLIVAALCGCTRPGFSTPKYNVILISIDTLRADRVGAYGFKEWNITPNIDGLVNRSVLFTNAYSTASITTASHMSMFTGLYPLEHGLSDPQFNSARFESLPPMLNEKIETLPQLLRKNGAHTARFVNSRDFFLDAAIGFGRGFDEDYPYGLDSFISAKSIASWFEKNANTRFFVFIHSKRPHAPYTFNDPILKRAEADGHLDANYKGPVISNTVAFSQSLLKNLDYVSSVPGVVPDGLYFLERARVNNGQDLRRLNQLYNLAVNTTDSFLSTVLSKLRDLGLMQNTIIVITSDHGEQMMEHGSTHHTHLTFEETHVPLLIYLPDGELNSRKVDKVSALVQTTDILPTVMSLLGLKTPKYVSGKDLMPLWKGSAEQVREEAYGFNRNKIYEWSDFIRTKRWSYFSRENSGELFDHEADPMEKHNVSSEHPDVSEAMRLKLKAMELKSYAFDPEGIK